MREGTARAKHPDSIAPPASPPQHVSEAKMMEMLLLPRLWQEKTPLLWMLPAPHAEGTSLNDNKI